MKSAIHIRQVQQCLKSLACLSILSALFIIPSPAQVGALRGRSAISFEGQAGTVTVTTPTPLPGGMVGFVYSQTLGASGGTAPYTWTVTGGTICAGLTLSSGGVVSGTPTTVQICSFMATATDSLLSSGGKTFSLSVLAGPGGGFTGGVVRAGGLGKGK